MSGDVFLMRFNKFLADGHILCGIIKLHINVYAAIKTDIKFSRQLNHIACVRGYEKIVLLYLTDL